MKTLQKIIFSILGISMFLIILYVSLTLLINNPRFYQKIWAAEGIYESMGISESDLTRVIKHTMDYMWGYNDDLQIQVTINGQLTNFYQNFGVCSKDGKIMDELAHMAECKQMFLFGKDLFILALVTASICIFVLIRNKEFLDHKSFTAFYISYGAIILIAILFTVLVVTNFDAAFDGFHAIFFKDSNIDFEFPASSYMIQMLPEYALFSKIVYQTLIHFFSFSAITFTTVILLQKRVRKAQMAH